MLQVETGIVFQVIRQDLSGLFRNCFRPFYSPFEESEEYPIKICIPLKTEIWNLRREESKSRNSRRKNNFHRKFVIFWLPYRIRLSNTRRVIQFPISFQLGGQLV